MDFEATIANFGLKEIKASTLILTAEGSEIITFEIGTLDIGSKKTITIKNLKIPRKTEKITLTAESPEKEISKNNNEAKLRIIPK